MKYLYGSIAYVLLCYPLNFWMMNENVGLYNDPTMEWTDGVKAPNRQKASDAQTRRAWCLVASPIFAPVAGFYTLADRTIPEEY